MFCHLERCLLFLSTSSPPFISSPSSGSILCIHKGLEGGIRACESVNTYRAKGNRSLKSPRLQSALYHLLSPFADFVQHRMRSAYTVGVGLFPVETTQLLELKMYYEKHLNIYVVCGEIKKIIIQFLLHVTISNVACRTFMRSSSFALYSSHQLKCFLIQVGRLFREGQRAQNVRLYSCYRFLLVCAKKKKESQETQELEKDMFIKIFMK